MAALNEKKKKLDQDRRNALRLLNNPEEAPKKKKS